MQLDAYTHLIGAIKGVRVAMAAPAEEVNPEEIAHGDQDAIDSAFGELMDGIEL